MSCICPVSSREWQSDGSCTGCNRPVSESQLQDAIRLALGSVPGLVLWRNNCGVLPQQDGRRIRYGVGNPGGADLIGCCRPPVPGRHIVAADLLEERGFGDVAAYLRAQLGRFVAVEIKTPHGKQTKEQRDFQQCVERNGGIYMLVHSTDQAVRQVEALRTGRAD